LADDKKKACLDEIIQVLLANPTIAEYTLGPNPPAKFELVRYMSKPLFFNSMTKQTLISSIYDIYKAQLAIQTILSKYTGYLSPSKEGSASFYG
jgi:hypothetical protein